MRLLLLLFLFVHCGLAAQEAEKITVNLRAGQLDFPVDLQRGSPQGVVIGWSLMPAQNPSAYRLDKGLTDYKIFAMPLSSLFSYNYCYLPDSLFRKRFDVLVARNAYSGTYRLWVDEDGDKDFSDEQSQTILPGKPLLRKVPLLANWQENSTALPLQFSLTGTGRNISLNVANLLKYHLEYALPDTSLQIDLLLNFYEANFRLKTTSLSESRVKETTYLMNEPFQFAGRFFQLGKPDVLSQTAELTILPPGAIPYGYKPGYYADVDRIRELVGKAEVLTSCLEAENENAEYLLLHFWMYWAQPCIDQFGELTHLGRELQKTGKVQMLNFPELRTSHNAQKEIPLLKEKIFTYSLPCMQILEQGSGGSCGLPFNQRNTVRAMLNVNAYPTYVLLNGEGKIIYRGDNKDHRLHALLKDLDLLNE